MTDELTTLLQPIDVTFLAHPKFLDSLPNKARSTGEKAAQAARRLGELQWASSGMGYREWVDEYRKAEDELGDAVLALGELLNLPRWRGHHTWQEVQPDTLEEQP